MRKHSARRWLHFIIDLLPFIIIPIFAIYEINHANNEPIEVTAQENVVVDFNQIAYDSNYHSEINYYGLIFTKYGETLVCSGTNTNTSRVQWNLNNGGYELDVSHVYYVTSYVTGAFDNMQIRGTFVLSDNSRTYPQLPYRNTGLKSVSFYLQNEGVPFNFDFSIQLQIFDLTQMFGAGYEPSSADFLTYFPYDFYNSTSSELVTISSTAVLYNDTDIGSQFIYSIYKPVHNYFNFDNVFNFGQLRQWFAINMFGGTMPLVVEIIWNVIIYEFISDIIMLVYNVFMFFIDFANDTLERFNGWSRKG